MKVAEALVLRKHLEAKVKQLEPIKLQGDRGLFELQTQRVKISDTVDEIKTQLPKVTLEDVMKEYNKYSKALRELDIKIQESNWTNEIEFSTENIAV